MKWWELGILDFYSCSTSNILLFRESSGSEWFLVQPQTTVTAEGHEVSENVNSWRKSGVNTRTLVKDQGRS